MKALLKAVNFIETAGFSHIKVELEGTTGRRHTNNRWACEPCKSMGVSPCDTCKGRGVTTENENNLFGTTTFIDCRECGGDGNSRCNVCNGNRNRGSFSSNLTCHQFVLEHVTKKLYGKALYEIDNYNYDEDEDGAEIYDAIDFLTYSYFYDDGSVDSELTFTIPVKEVRHLPLFIEGFSELGKVAGNGKIDVRGAGMHIAILPSSSNGRYPCPQRVDSNKLNNFVSEVSKLLPALYFLGTAGHRTRSFNYRNPKISDDKYSAICTHGGRTFEYRVFETCYERPEAIFDFVQVIANTLKFFHDPNLKVKFLGKKFGFTNTRAVANYFSTPEQLRILNATVKYLKPEDKTFKQLKAERGLKYNIKSLSLKERAIMGDLKRDYDEYKKNFEYTQNKPLTSYEESQVEWLIIEDNYTEDKAIEAVKANRNNGSRLISFSQFVDRNLNKRSTGAVVTV